MNKVHKTITTPHYTPSSKHFTIYTFAGFETYIEFQRSHILSHIDTRNAGSNPGTDTYIYCVFKCCPMKVAA